MKTFSNPVDREEILRRLRTVRPTSQRRWGTMTAHQMICHLGDAFRAAIGERYASPAPGWVPRPFLRWIALWTPLPWPHGFPTCPELDQTINGTPPAVFDGDVQALLGILDRITRRPCDFEWQRHTHFGRMSGNDWMRLAYLHIDHHLRQFGA
jgi:hypothetical protein